MTLKSLSPLLFRASLTLQDNLRSCFISVLVLFVVLDPLWSGLSLLKILFPEFCLGPIVLSSFHILLHSWHSRRSPLAVLFHPTIPACLPHRSPISSSSGLPPVLCSFSFPRCESCRGRDVHLSCALITKNIWDSSNKGFKRSYGTEKGYIVLGEGRAR